MKDVIWTAFADEMEKFARVPRALQELAFYGAGLGGIVGLSKMLPGPLAVPSDIAENTRDKIRADVGGGRFGPHGQEGSSGRGLKQFWPAPDELNPRQMGQFIRRKAIESTEDVRGRYPSGYVPGMPARSYFESRDQIRARDDAASERSPREASRRAAEYEDLANEVGMPRRTLPLNLGTLSGGGYLASRKPFPQAKAHQMASTPGRYEELAALKGDSDQ